MNCQWCGQQRDERDRLTAEVERLTADAAFWKREEKAQRKFSKAVTADRDRLRSELALTSADGAKS